MLIRAKTVDREYINKTSFFTISSVKEGDKFNIQRAASKPTPTGISMVHEDLGKISADTLITPSLGSGSMASLHSVEFISIMGRRLW